MLIRLQLIYNLLSIHAIILSFLDVLQSFYSNFISFFGTNLLTQCLVPVAIFCLFFTSQKINIKRSPNTAKLYGDFFGLEGTQWARAAPGGCPEGAQPTRARQGPLACPCGLCPPRWPPAPLLRPIKSQIFQNPSG